MDNKTYRNKFIINFLTQSRLQAVVLFIYLEGNFSTQKNQVVSL
jgi:hypothetical protein